MTGIEFRQALSLTSEDAGKSLTERRVGDNRGLLNANTKNNIVKKHTRKMYIHVFTYLSMGKQTNSPIKYTLCVHLSWHNLFVICRRPTCCIFHTYSSPTHLKHNTKYSLYNDIKVASINHMYVNNYFRFLN